MKSIDSPQVDKIAGLLRYYLLQVDITPPLGGYHLPCPRSPKVKISLPGSDSE